MLSGWIIIDSDRHQLFSGRYCEERITAGECGAIDSLVKTSHICPLCPVVVSLSQLIAKWVNMCHALRIVQTTSLECYSSLKIMITAEGFEEIIKMYT